MLIYWKLSLIMILYFTKSCSGNNLKQYQCFGMKSNLGSMSKFSDRLALFRINASCSGRDKAWGVRTRRPAGVDSMMSPVWRLIMKPIKVNVLLSALKKRYGWGLQTAESYSFACLLLNGTSALFRLLVTRIVEIKHVIHVKTIYNR